MPQNTPPYVPHVTVLTEGQIACPASSIQTVSLSADPPAETGTDRRPPGAPARRPRAATRAASAELSTAQTPSAILPEVSLEHTDPGEATRTRRGVLQSKRDLEAGRSKTFAQTRGQHTPEEKNALYQEIRWYADKAEVLERHLNEHFLPQHGPEQLLSPRAFFVSPLFRVRSKTRLREKHVEMSLPTSHGTAVIRYAGPELRQSDGLVFLALVHMLRDVQVGTAVSLQPEAVCLALFGRYDGNSRRQLREHIQRLQQGLLIFETFSVQMCLRFDYPKTGRWTVALDRHITELFRLSPTTWFALRDRLSLPDGLATWLYAFVSSHTRLIPTKLERLRELCGSDAGEKAFGNRLREALKLLAAHGVVDTGWSVGHGEVRWRKPLKAQ